MRWYPHRIPNWFKLIFPSLEWKGKTSSIHLTFDDGPHSEITPWVLQHLKQHNQKATFFLIGDNAEKHPEIIEQIMDEGHSIGNHTQHHLKYHKNPLKKWIENIEHCDRQIPSTKLFRPPFGRIGLRGIRALKKRRIIMWTLLSGDFDNQVDIDNALRHLKAAQSGDIIVFHDSEKAFPQLKQLLPPLLEHFNAHQIQSSAL